MNIRYQAIPADEAGNETSVPSEKLGSFADAFISYLISVVAENGISLMGDTENSISINTILALANTCTDLNEKLRNDALWEEIAKHMLKEPEKMKDKQLPIKEMVMSSIKLADIIYHKAEYLKDNHILALENPSDDICAFQSPSSDCSRNTCQSLVGTFGSVGFLGGAVFTGMQINGPCIPFWSTAAKFACFTTGGGIAGFGVGTVAGFAIYGTVEGCRYAINLHHNNKNQKHNAPIRDQLDTYDHRINELNDQAFDLKESCTLALQDHVLRTFSLFRQPAEVRMMDDEMVNKNAYTRH